jgi:hypothetical protein
MKRDEMLKLLHRLKKPHVEYSGTCVAGFDLDVATSAGAGTACCAWGSREVEGPVRLTPELRDRIEAADSDSEDDLLDDLDEEVVEVYRAMIAARCRTGVDYFHVLMSEEGERFFSTQHDKVYDEWAGSAAMGAELTAWEEMEDGELERWVKTLGLTPTRKPRTSSTPSKARTRRRASRKAS